MRSFSALRAVALSVPLSISPTVCCALLVIGTQLIPRYERRMLSHLSKSSRSPGSIFTLVTSSCGTIFSPSELVNITGRRSAIARKTFFAVITLSAVTLKKMGEEAMS